jgi:predicted nucleic acid-binding protein
VSDPGPLVIADASVVINLSATGCAAAIVDALPFRIAVPEIVATELREDHRSGRDDAALLRDLAATGRITIIPLDEADTPLFVDLIAGPTIQTLDDGEAATIAVAINRGAVAAIDERKARRICTMRFPKLQMLSTCELLLDEHVAGAVGRHALGEAIFRALQTARMRVLPEHVRAIVQLIGVDRAPQCPSLPRTARER